MKQKRKAIYLLTWQLDFKKLTRVYQHAAAHPCTAINPTYTAARLIDNAGVTF